MTSSRSVGSIAIDAPHPLPESAAGQQPRLQHLDEPCRQLLAWQRHQRPGISEHCGWQVVGAGVVLALGQVHSCLPTVSGVDLRDQSGWDLNNRNATLVGVGAEAGEVADHAAAEGDDVVLAGHSGPSQIAQHSLGLGHSL